MENFEEIALACLYGNKRGLFFFSSGIAVYSDNLERREDNFIIGASYFFKIGNYDKTGYFKYEVDKKGKSTKYHAIELGDVVNFIELETKYIYEFNQNPAKMLGRKVICIADKITLDDGITKKVIRDRFGQADI